MLYLVYRTTNLINGFVYIGKHQTRNPEDNYLGSGKRLLKAIKKYGKDNFKRDILHVFDDEFSMNAKEAELVTEEFIKREDTYNLCPGGKGGWGYVNSLGLNTTGDRDYAAIAVRVQQTKKTRTYTISEESRRQVSERNKLTNESRGEKTSRALRGRQKSEEHRAKIAASVKKAHEARRNKKCGVGV